MPDAHVPGSDAARAGVDVVAEDVELGPTGNAFVLVDHARAASGPRAIGPAARPVQRRQRARGRGDGAGRRLPARRGRRRAPARARRRPGPARARRRRDQPFTVLVDYAHTPDALAPRARRRPADLDDRDGSLVVFGCGGDRDREKRPRWVAPLAGGADVIVLTSDNPRSEEPERDRRARSARGCATGGARSSSSSTGAPPSGTRCSEARPGDVVVIAGKGHETGQTAGGGHHALRRPRRRPRGAGGARMRLTAEEVVEATGGELIAGDRERAADSYVDRHPAPRRGRRASSRCTASATETTSSPTRSARGATIAVVGRAPSTPVTPPGRGRQGRATRWPRWAHSVSAAHAAGWRRATVVGITGSAGKTATKDLLAAALGRTPARHRQPGLVQQRGRASRSRCWPPMSDTEVVVAEMGARFAGNIAELCAIARPQVGVITNVGMAHAGLLGGRGGHRRGQGRAARGAARRRDRGARRRRRVHARAGGAARAHGCVRVGGGDVPGRRRSRHRRRARRASSARLPARHAVGHGRSCRLGVRGEHQVVNAAMAAAVALELGVPLERGRRRLGRRRDRGLADGRDPHARRGHRPQRRLQRQPDLDGGGAAGVGRSRRWRGGASPSWARCSSSGPRPTRPTPTSGGVAVECGVDVVVVGGRGARAVGDRCTRRPAPGAVAGGRGRRRRRPPSTRSPARSTPATRCS